MFPESWPGSSQAIHALLLLGCRKEDVDARDIRAFAPVFDGLCCRHDDGESYIEMRF
jgi:hypothetical protein